MPILAELLKLNEDDELDKIHAFVMAYFKKVNFPKILPSRHYLLDLIKDDGLDPSKLEAAFKKHEGMTYDKYLDKYIGDDEPEYPSSGEVTVSLDWGEEMDGGSAIHNMVDDDDVDPALKKRLAKLGDSPKEILAKRIKAVFAAEKIPVKVNVVSMNGPGGGWPQVHITGDAKQIKKWMIDSGWDEEELGLHVI